MAFSPPGAAKNEPAFVQARHDEMAEFEAVCYAKFSGKVGVCAGSPGPGAIHLTNWLGSMPPSWITFLWSRSSGNELSLLCAMVTVPQQLPNVLDRAIRVAQSRRAPSSRQTFRSWNTKRPSTPSRWCRRVSEPRGPEWCLMTTH